MRDYFRICPRFWTGDTGKKIIAAGPDATILALYLLTSPHAHGTGLYYLPLAYAAHETKRTEAALKPAMVLLAERGFCLYDFADEIVFVPEMAQHQIGDTLKSKDMRRQYVAKHLALFRGHPFVSKFLARYAVDYGLPSTPLEGGPQPPSKGVPNPPRSGSQSRSQKKGKGI